MYFTYVWHVVLICDTFLSLFRGFYQQPQHPGSVLQRSPCGSGGGRTRGAFGSRCINVIRLAYSFICFRNMPSPLTRVVPFPGIVDDLTAAGVPCFGPSAKASQLEASKSFSKAFMERHGIPTARYGSFTNALEACQYIRTSVQRIRAGFCVSVIDFCS